jgi:MFS family permease
LLTLVVRSVGAEQRGRAVGLLQGGFLFGMTVGPLVGGVLATPLGLRWPFFIYALFCGGAGLVGLRFLPQPSAGGGGEQLVRRRAAGSLRATWTTSLRRW